MLGEQVWAFVVPREGVKLAPADVWDSCRKELTAYKVPDKVRIVDSLPMTSTGKVQKFALRQAALEQHS